VLAVDGRADRVFVAIDGPALLSVRDARTGRPLGTVDLGGQPLAMAVDSRLRHLFVSVLKPAGGRSAVRVFDSRSGALLATWPVGRFVGALLSDGRARRVLVASDGDTYLLDARDGRVRRRIAGGGAPLAVDERAGRALLGGRGHLQLIATADGTRVAALTGRGALDPSAIQAVGVDERAGRFYVATDSALWVLDDRSGRIAHVLSLPGTPVALAVDPGAQRVYVLSVGTGGAASPDRASSVLGWLRRTLPWLPILAAPSTAAQGTLTVVDTTRL
jgi:hypothetical protein